MQDAPEGLTRAPVGAAAPEGRKTFELTRISTIIDKALKGELGRERALHPDEPSVLTPAHVNMVLDKAGGFTNREIAERWEYSAVQVANVLGHPDSQTILSTIFALQAEHLTDIEQRFKAMAPEALNVKAQMLRDPDVGPAVRDRIASDILDRAGYAPRVKVETSHKHQFLMPAQAATGLKDVLEESRRASLSDFSRFLQKTGGEVAATHLQIAEVGHLESTNGASPDPQPVLLESERGERVA